MDRLLIQNWNSRVSSDDEVFVIGDFCFKSVGYKNFEAYDKSLNGKKIFIKGNHDNNNSTKTSILDVTLFYGGKRLQLIHRPEDASIGFDLVLCGHVHTKWKFETRELPYEKLQINLCNVGVDQWMFAPVKIEEILKAYQKWKHESL
jgi:calcineurin-like phosphoesterase family protein